MSHMTKRTTEYKSAAAIAEAAAALGLEALGEGEVRFYGTGHGSWQSAQDRELSKTADLRFQAKGSRYHLGFRAEADGTYSMVADEEVFAGGYARHDPIRRALGEASQYGVAPLFRQAYNVAVLAAKARGQGKHVTTERAGQVIRLRVRA
ncbi:MAG: DUF1257 domain-containing protein [bacterium]